MILYHGSNVVVKNPKILISERGRDFGFAFYLTSIKEQAERMAIRKKKQHKNGTPIVSVFEWDEDCTNLKTISYNEPDLDWLEMILKCRTDIDYVHGYDLVIGKIADDSVGETVLFVLDGVITKEDALKRLKFEKINSQVAFCSQESLKHLKYIESYEVK